jgi:hypothetical protein
MNRWLLIFVSGLNPTMVIIQMLIGTTRMHSPVATVIGVGETSGVVKVDLLIDLAKQGLSNTDPVVRLYLYELILHIRPPDRAKWESSSSSRNALYWGWVGKYFAAAADWLERTFTEDGVTQKDFGLSDNETMAQIHGDLSRTPDADFAEVGLGGSEAEIRPHMRRLERLLYVFSCLNAAYSVSCDGPYRHVRPSSFSTSDRRDRQPDWCRCLIYFPGLE